MKVISQNKDSFFLRFERGEDLAPTLQAFCQRQEIKAASFQGIGACSEAILSWYNPDQNLYEDQQFAGAFEIISLTGNVADSAKGLIVHAHTCLAGKDLKAIAGHVKKLLISVTCELHLQLLPNTLKRAPLPGTALWLLE